MYNYIGYNYVFRPCVLAIIRLSLDLSSNYTISVVFWGVWGVVGRGLVPPPPLIVLLLEKSKDNLMMAETKGRNM